MAQERQPRSGAALPYARTRAPTGARYLIPEIRLKREVGSRGKTKAGTLPPRSRRGGISARSHILQPGVDLTLGLVLGNAVSLLDPTNQLDATALDETKVIMRELAAR